LRHGGDIHGQGRSERCRLQSPTPDTAVVFEEGAVLTVQQFSVDGVLVFTRATNGAQHNGVTEVTCTFTSGAGDTFVVTGILGGA
jgi:hypothetical protein